MKSFGFMIHSFVCAAVALAELDTLWTQQLAIDPQSAGIEAAVLMQDGRVMVAGAATRAGVVDLWRLSQSGDVEWTGFLQFPASYVEILGMVQMQQGHFILAATYSPQGDSTTVLSFRGFTAEGAVLWTRTYALSSIGWQADFVLLSDNTAALFTSLFDESGLSVARLFKVSSSGDTLWSRQISPAAQVPTYGHAVCELSNGDLVLGGYYETPSFTYEAFIMRTTPLGVPVWTNTYAGQAFGLAVNCLDRDAQDRIVAGGADGSFWWFTYGWAKGLNPDGSERWSLADDMNFGINASGIRATSDGGAVIAGTSFSDWGPIEARVFPIDDEGRLGDVLNFNSSYSYLEGMSTRGSRGAIAYGSITTQDNTYAGLLVRFGPGTTVTGFVREQGTNLPVVGARVELAETGEYGVTDAQGVYLTGVSETSGTLRVTHPCIAPAQQTVTLVEGEDNVVNFTVSVPTYSNSVSSLNMVATYGMIERDTLFISNSGNGDLYFRTSVHEQMPAYGWLSASPEQGILAPGQSAEIYVYVLANPEFPNSEFFGEVRVHHNACPDTLDEVGVFVLALDSPERPEPVTSFAVHTAYPNPFNNTARVAFDLPQTAQIEAKLYSIDGREAAKVASGSYSAGRHELTIEGDALATGVYILRMTAGASVATQKLVLLK